jgi:hypothetical protein
VVADGGKFMRYTVSIRYTVRALSIQKEKSSLATFQPLVGVENDSDAATRSQMFRLIEANAVSQTAMITAW